MYLQALQAIGPELDMRREADRWRLLLTWVQVYRLLTVMSRNLAELRDRLPLYEVIGRGPGR